jgi:5-methylcytosine-specific restriction endonuclease McrA
MTNITELDTNRFYLGRLCKYGHDWNCTGKSLRRKDYRVCTECQLWHKRKSYWKHRKKNRESAAAYYQKHREEIRQKHANHYQEHKEDYRRRQSKLLRTPQKKESWRQYMSKFRQTPQGKIAAKRAKFRRRAYKLYNHHTHYSLQQIESLNQRFDHACAYCGATVNLVLDHFIPVSKGGPDCVGNFIPACHNCNTNKRDHDPIIWYKSQPFYSLKRWKLILEVLGKTESNYNQLPLF